MSPEQPSEVAAEPARSPPPPAEEALERPTTGQLAQLAAILANRPEALQISPAEVVLEAMQLWEAAAKITLAERQEQTLWQALWTDSRAQWEFRLKNYAGDEARLHELLAEPRFDAEREVLPRLFPTPEETLETRRQKFIRLVAYAQAEGSGQAEGPSPESWLTQKLSALFVRALVDAQQVQAGRVTPG